MFSTDTDKGVNILKLPLWLLSVDDYANILDVTDYSQIMIIEIVLIEEKAKLHGIDVNKGYKAIDDYFENRGVPKLGQGIFECIEDDNSFSTFSVAIAQLPETKWFPLLVEKWLWYIQGEVEDCISSLKGITL